jgi:hypothetical protein
VGTMSEPFIEHLSRFTPDAGRLNRDELLFLAGRRSARPDRRWMSSALLLGATQTLTLVLLWPNPRPNSSGLTVTRVVAPEPPAALEQPALESSATDRLWSARRGLSGSEPENGAAGELTLIDSEPPLRAFAPLPRSLLN